MESFSSSSTFQLSRPQKHMIIRSLVKIFVPLDELKVRYLLDISNKNDLKEFMKSKVPLILNEMLEIYTNFKNSNTSKIACAIFDYSLCALGQLDELVRNAYKDVDECLDDAQNKKLMMIRSIQRSNKKRKTTNSDALAFVSLYLMPAIRQIAKEDIECLPQQHLSSNRRNIVMLVKLLNCDWPDEKYVAKYVVNNEPPLTREIRALGLAHFYPDRHPGIVYPLALLRDTQKPMVIYKYWNGGSLYDWITKITIKPNTIMPVDYKEVPLDVGSVLRFKKHVFALINGLLRTVMYMHERNIIHNNLNPSNMVLHFPSDVDDVYIGMLGWSNACINGNYVLFNEPFWDEGLKRRNAYFVAPEMIESPSMNGSESSDIYSLCKIINAMLQCLVVDCEPKQMEFIQQLRRKIALGTNAIPSKRCPLHEIEYALTRANNYGIIVKDGSGLLSDVNWNHP